MRVFSFFVSCARCSVEIGWADSMSPMHRERRSLVGGKLIDFFVPRINVVSLGKIRFCVNMFISIGQVLQVRQAFKGQMSFSSWQLAIRSSVKEVSPLICERSYCWTDPILLDCPIDQCAAQETTLHPTEMETRPRQQSYFVDRALFLCLRC